MVEAAQQIPLVETFQRLRTKLDELGRAITTEDGGLPAYAARLPFPYEEQPLPTVLTVEPLRDEDARAYGAELIRAVQFQEHQDPKAALRAPGLFAAGERTLGLIAEINELKDAFEAGMNALQTRALKKEMAQKISPYLHRRQLARHITVLPAVPEKVSFTWAAHTPAITRRTVEQIWKQLQADAKQIPSDTDPEGWRLMLEHERRALEGLPGNEVLAQRKMLAPHPRANIYMAGENPTAAPCNLPMFYPDGQAELPPLKLLETLDRSWRRAERRDKRVEAEPLISRLNLYRYTEPYRKYAETEEV